MMAAINIAPRFDPASDLVLFQGDCLDLLATIPDGFATLVVTSPPYNLGKSYEKRRQLNYYLDRQTRVITECVRVLDDSGSLCWQVGNYVEAGEIVPLDILLYPIFANLGMRLRNRIVWHFEHGLHASRRFSGRYEVILWFTKGASYTFNLDQVRVPQKYPNKRHFKGPNRGELSGHPLGKNPGDLWQIPNVKANHVEKTVHPCQFPVELVERLILSLTNAGDWVLDPFVGVGSTAIAALLHGRRAIGAEVVPEYVELARQRIGLAEQGVLRIRPMERPVYDPERPAIAVPPRLVRIDSFPAANPARGASVNHLLESTVTTDVELSSDV
jgi:adenine-specific DNA-methyltransferase